jgi:hypothetical protein
MTAPERIWVGDERPVGGTIHVWNELAEHARRYATEYTRADIVPDLAALVRAALEAAACELDGCNLGLDPADMAEDIRAIAADPDQVAAIVAKAKGAGE